MALINKLSAIGDAIREKTGKADKLTLDQMPLEIASIVSGGSSGAKVTEYVVTENADRSLWLNEQNIKLVKGVNILTSSNFAYSGANNTYIQGEITMIVMLWDGVSGTINNGTNSQSTKAHLRGFQTVCSQWTPLASITSLAVGNTSAITVAGDGTLTCTTSATGVTTGNYNNSFISAGNTYYLLQVESEVVC